MVEMDDGSSKPPQMSDMFHKFALAFKTKTSEFFADVSDGDPGFGLLDSADEFIADQRVVVIKPAPPPIVSSVPPPSTASTVTEPPATLKEPIDTHVTQALISSLFATASSLKSSYLQLQSAHAPFDEERIKAADQAILLQLRKLSEIKQFYRYFNVSSDLNLDFAIGSCLESQVQENQCMLRALETLVNRLQSEIDGKHSSVLSLRQNLDKVQKSSKELLKKLRGTSVDSPPEVMLSVTAFDSVLRDTCRSMYRFTRLQIALMRRAGWDLDLAAKSIHPDINYAKLGHNRYALLSYVCLGMFQDFDSEGFGLGSSEILCSGSRSLKSCKDTWLKQLVEHLAFCPMETLSRTPNCEFSKFCEKKYQLIVHPLMESSIFSNLDKDELEFCSWNLRGVFYEAFVNMASSVWVLHKMAFSFDPTVEIFQVQGGIEFSIVFMKDVTKRFMVPGKSRPKVGFTVVPGFKIGNTVIQSQVYLSASKRTGL